MAERINIGDAVGHARFPRHEQTRADFHAAQEVYQQATRAALAAGAQYFATPHDARVEEAYRRAMRAEARAADALREAREALLESLGHR